MIILALLILNLNISNMELKNDLLNKLKIITKISFSVILIFFIVNPAVLFAQDDTENAEGVVYITGALKMDDQGVYLESSDCLYNKKYYLGGVLSEDTGDKKANKKNKKANKKVAKKIKKTAKKVKKADNQTVLDQEIKGTLGEKDGYHYISPLKVISPMFEPVATGLSPACDLTLLAIYGLYVETQRIKKLSRIISWKTVTSEDGMEEELKFYDSPANGCREIGMDELKEKSAEIKDVLRQANTAVVLNLGAIGLVLANMKQMKAEIENGNALEKIAGIASIAQAVSLQARVLGDNKRLQDRIKEAESIMEQIESL